MIRIRALTLGAALLLVVAGLAACGGSDNEVETATAKPSTSPATSEGGAGVPATVAPRAEGTTLDVFFVRDEKLGTAHRRIASTPAVGRAAIEQLLAGPTDAERTAGLATAIPVGTRLLGLDIADGVATVDLSSTYVSGGGSLSMRERLAQVAFTLTQFPTVDRVRFSIDGTPTTVFGGEGVTLDGPAGRTEFTDVTPFILVQTPAPGDLVSSPLTVSGLNNTFEGTVRIRIEGADGRTLADTFTTGEGDLGTWGPFEDRVSFDPGADTTGTVVVFSDSPRDGSAIDVVQVPVRFA